MHFAVRVAIGTGATRGDGRGVTAAWGEAAATRICTGCVGRAVAALAGNLKCGGWESARAR